LEKERRQWRIGSVICEIDSVTVGAKTLKSICCEATDPEALKHLIERLGIGDMKNRSYLDLLQDFPD
jgi:adenylate cyclase class IV